MQTISERLGKAIFDYFIQRTSPGEKFYLAVDSYTYEYCARLAGLKDDEIEQLQSRFTFYGLSEYNDLAIAALEVKIAYDIETDSDLINSYNPRLIKNYGFHSKSRVQNFYKTYDQEGLWKKVKDLFKKENRNLIIPEEKTGPGRYVQYPLKQRLISGTSIIKYADRFIELGLEQNSGITFDYFEKLVLKKSVDKMIKRMVFSFYCMWDGRSYEEIYTHTRISNAQREQQAKDEFCIRLEPVIEIYINQKKIDFEKDEIADKYLWKFGEKTHKGRVFVQDENYNDWLPLARNKAIDADEDVLLISRKQNFPKYIEDFRENGKAEIFEKGKYNLILLSSLSQEEFETIGIKVKKTPYFSLTGGLKLKRNTYYDFALPVIKLNENILDKTKAIFIDSKEYPVENGFAKIADKLTVGKHFVKLFNSWNSSEVYFYVENVPNAEIADIHGWNLNFSENTVSPSVQVSDKVIDGIICRAKLEWIDRKEAVESDKQLRNFQEQNDLLLNRYEKIGNIKLNKGGRYGFR